MPDRIAPDPHVLDASPICGDLRAWSPLTLQVVSQSPREPLWDQLVRRYHYLGYQQLLGHRLKYLAYLQDRPVAALSFSAPARVLRVRDRWIGWSAAQRHAHLDRVVNNSRFLILPWVQLPNLASQVLARTLAHLPQAWAARFGTRLWRPSSIPPASAAPATARPTGRPSARPPATASKALATCTMASSRRSTPMS